MYGNSYIQELVKDAAQEARENGLTPTPIRTLDLDHVPPFPFPFLGDYVPDGWTLCESIDPLFVDSSGFGSTGEPALTVDQFIARLRDFQKSGDPYGFAIVETGQFQIYVGVYLPDPRDFTRTGALRPGLRERDAADLIHALMSPELYRLLVVDRGWTPQRYQQWLATTLADQLLADLGGNRRDR